MSNSLWPLGLQHTRPPCPSPTPGVYSNSYPLSRWCHPTISSSVIPFSCPQSFPASGSFQMSPFFASGGQSIGVSALASVLSINIQDWFSLGWTGWITLQSKGLPRVISNITVQTHQLYGAQLFPYMTTGTIALTRWTFVGNIMSLLLNMLSKLIITFLSRSKNLLISWLGSLSAVIFQFSSVSQSCPTLCNPMNHSTPGLPVHHQLPESTQTHVHRVSDAIQPSHPLSAPSPSAPNPSQHQSLFQWVNSSHEVAKVLEFQL